LQNQQLESSHLAIDAALNVLRGEYPRAVEQYIRALTIDSINGSAAHGLVNAFVRMKKFKEAEATIARIRLELERRNLGESQAMLGFFLARARLLVAQENLAEALAVCDSALDHSSPLSRGVVYRQVAEIKLRQQQYEDAFDACEEALRVNPNNPDALLTLMKIYHAQGDLRMTHEIGGRLMEFWEGADDDFRYLREVKQMLAP
jgi:tetratricopeptide (TPR) repeat protein